MTPISPAVTESDEASRRNERGSLDSQDRSAEVDMVRHLRQFLIRPATFWTDQKQRRVEAERSSIRLGQGKARLNTGRRRPSDSPDFVEIDRANNVWKRNSPTLHRGFSSNSCQLRELALGAFPFPPGDTAIRTQNQDPVNPDFGQLLNDPLGPVSLWQRETDRDRRPHGMLDPDLTVWPQGAADGEPARPPRSPTVADRNHLAIAQPQHTLEMMRITLVEYRTLHRLDENVRCRAAQRIVHENADLMRENRPFSCDSTYSPRL